MKAGPEIYDDAQLAREELCPRLIASVCYRREFGFGKGTNLGCLSEGLPSACGHRHCTRCTKKLFKTALKDSSLLPLQCMNISGGRRAPLSRRGQCPAIRSRRSGLTSYLCTLNRLQHAMGTRGATKYVFMAESVVTETMAIAPTRVCYAARTVALPFGSHVPIIVSPSAVVVG
jgi:hypothetical protein